MVWETLYKLDYGKVVCVHESQHFLYANFGLRAPNTTHEGTHIHSISKYPFVAYRTHCIGDRIPDRIPDKIANIILKVYSLNYLDADSQCRSMGGFLPVPQNASANSWLLRRVCRFVYLLVVYMTSWTQGRETVLPKRPGLGFVPGHNPGWIPFPGWNLE